MKNWYTLSIIYCFKVFSEWTNVILIMNVLYLFSFALNTSTFSTQDGFESFICDLFCFCVLTLTTVWMIDLLETAFTCLKQDHILTNTRKWLKIVCRRCQNNRVWRVNVGLKTGLLHSVDRLSLVWSEVPANFPSISCNSLLSIVEPWVYTFNGSRYPEGNAFI